MTLALISVTKQSQLQQTFKDKNVLPSIKPQFYSPQTVTSVIAFLPHLLPHTTLSTPVILQIKVDKQCEQGHIEKSIEHPCPESRAAFCTNLTYYIFPN